MSPINQRYTLFRKRKESITKFGKRKMAIEEYKTININLELNTNSSY